MQFAKYVIIMLSLLSFMTVQKMDILVFGINGLQKLGHATN